KATTRFLVIVCWRTRTTEGSGRTVPPVPTRPGCAPAQDGMQSQGNAMPAPPGAMATSVARSRAMITTEDVSYAASGTTLRGHLAVDDAMRGKRPGILVVHEWWGVNDHMRRRARMLAELGYTALAADMYGEGRTATDPNGAGTLM